MHPRHLAAPLADAPGAASGDEARELTKWIMRAVLEQFDSDAERLARRIAEPGDGCGAAPAEPSVGDFAVCLFFFGAFFFFFFAAFIAAFLAAFLPSGV